MTDMHKPTPEELQLARALINQLEGEFSRACLTAHQIEGWLHVARERGEVRMSLSECLESARIAHYGRPIELKESVN